MLPQTPLGELTALRQTPTLNLRGPTSKGKMGNGREGAGRGREGKGKGRKGEEGSGGSKGIGGQGPFAGGLAIEVLVYLTSVMSL